MLLRALFMILGATAVGVAVMAEAEGVGLFNNVALPFYAKVIIGFLLMDLAIWAQHWMFHKVPAFWQLHAMHHADTDIDVSTGLRFHPLEIILSMAIKCMLIVVLGLPALAVLIFEVVLNATSMFNHANMNLPQAIDRVLRLFVVTPDMHRVHHSIEAREHNRNFGFNLPWWDRLFRTYQAQPDAGHDGMTIGLPIHREPEWRTIKGLLTMPFSREILGERS